MKAAITCFVISFFAALSTYLQADENAVERAYFIFIGISAGFVYRHWIYESKEI